MCLAVYFCFRITINPLYTIYNPIYIYIYIYNIQSYIYRERERERDHGDCATIGT